MLTLCSHINAKDYYITDFGAKGDGIMLCTTTIQHAIDIVSQRGGGRIIFPKMKKAPRLGLSIA